MHPSDELAAATAPQCHPAPRADRLTGPLADGLAAAICLVVGVVLSVLPHLVWWPTLGSPVWIADHDELFYLAVGGQSYFHHPTYPSDPVRVTGGASIYRPLPLVPGIALARWLGQGPLGISLDWRIGGGLAIALGWYLVSRQFVRRPPVAAAITILLLADCGMLDGRPLARHAMLASRVALGRTPGPLFAGKPNVHPQWRVTTPAVTMAYLALAIVLLARARDRPTWPRLVASGLGFGLLFHVYFYYWTAAGLALLLGVALDGGRRRVYFHTGWIGGLVGLPAVIGDTILKRSSAPDWLQRSDKFLPIGHFSELLIPWVALVVALALLAWTWWRRRELFPIAALVVSGLALSNHQVVTGLQIENFHWVYVWGPCLTLLILLVIAAEVGGCPSLSKGRTIGFAVVAGVVALTGIWLRAVEAKQSRESVAILADYVRYKAQRLGPGTPPLARNAVAAGRIEFVDLASILEDQRPLANYAVTLSPSVTNAEWAERLALNALLLGVSRADFESQQRRKLERSAWGPWMRSPAARRALLEDEVAQYDRQARDLPAGCRRFAVHYVALPADQPRPAYLGDGGWRLVQDGPSWQIWEFDP